MESGKAQGKMSHAMAAGNDSTIPVASSRSVISTVPRHSRQSPLAIEDHADGSREAKVASIRRRMRVVTGSSAELFRLPMRSGEASIVWAALSALICSASSEIVGRGSPLSSSVLPESPDGASHTHDPPRANAAPVKAP